MSDPRMQNPTYLGDGVYAGNDGYHIWLSSGSHENPPVIALDIGTLEALIAYAKSMIMAKN